MSKADATVNLAMAIPIFKFGKVFNILGSSTGRVVANNLVEQLAMQEIMSNPAMGRVIMPSISDPRRNGWSKMLWNNARVEVYYLQNGRMEF